MLPVDRFDTRPSAALTVECALSLLGLTTKHRFTPV
jgi:hypothetical protein